jgi:ligand-binding sensor domain-containing protein
MKYIPHYALLMLVFLSYCGGQKQTKVPQANTQSHRSGLTEAQLEEAVKSKVPMSMVRHVKQAKNGDILVASYVGVYRYSDSDFTNITSTIKWPTFWDVLEDRKGNIWFASQDSGIYYYPFDSLKANVKALPDAQGSLQHFTTKDGAANSALHIYEDKTGNIWFGATRYNGKSFKNFTKRDGFPTNNIRLLLEDKTGKFWFGAQGEDMFVYDARLNGEFGVGKTFTVLKNKDGKAFNNVWGIIEDTKGNIWFGATIIEDKRGDTSFVADGLWRYDGSNFTKVSNQKAYAIIQDKKGNIWTTGEVKNNSWALLRYDAKSLYYKNPTITEITSQQGMLLGMVEDAKGNIWFGAGNGVFRYDGETITDFKSTAAK